MIDTRSFEVSPPWDWFFASYMQRHQSPILDEVTDLSLSPAWQRCMWSCVGSDLGTKITMGILSLIQLDPQL
jgi:hypothetical protein